MEYREQKHESTIEAAALNPPAIFFRGSGEPSPIPEHFAVGGARELPGAVPSARTLLAAEWWTDYIRLCDSAYL